MTRSATTLTPVRRPGVAARLQAAMRSAPLAAALAIGTVHGQGPSGAPEPPGITVHVVSHGWHSGIIVPAALADAHDWPVRKEFPRAEYYEVGWGDRAYYQATDPGWWLGLRALLWPNPGVLQMVAIEGPPQAAFPATPMVAVRVSHEGAQRLAASIAASHQRDTGSAAIALGPALYGQGRFYASVERFHLFATCNVWVARRLHDGGLDLHPSLALTAGMLFGQLARHVPAPAASVAPAAN
jgi:uncharacterized protein (TIGR02117 family)